MYVLWFSAKSAKKPKCYRHFLPNLSYCNPVPSSPNMYSNVPILLSPCCSSNSDFSSFPILLSFILLEVCFFSSCLFQPIQFSFLSFSPILQLLVIFLFLYRSHGSQKSGNRRMISAGRDQQR